MMTFTIRTVATATAIASMALASSACQQSASDTPGNASTASTGAPGAMTEAERAAYMQRHNVGFTAVDANSDGRVTVEESGANARSTLGGADTDRDGAISAAELARVNPNVRSALLRADADGDGAISSAEFDGHVADRFRVMDANGDGGVTVEEMQAAPPPS